MSDLGEQPDPMSGWCPSCKDGDHQHHRPALAGICIGCSCPERPGVDADADEYAGPDDVTERQTDVKPSAELADEDLDTALLLLVVSADGKTRMWVEPTVDPGQLAKGLRRTAKYLEKSRERTIEDVRTMLDPT